MKNVFEESKMPFDLLKRVLSLWYQIKGLMTSKDTGHFLSLLPGAETPAQSRTWTFPAARSLPRLASNGRIPGGNGLHLVQEVKAAHSQRPNR